MVDVATEQPLAGGIAGKKLQGAAWTRRRLGAQFWLPLGWLLLITGLAILAPWLGLPDPAHPDFIHTQNPPSGAHWFGTDVLGRDILSRTIFGARVSLVVGFFAPGIGMGCGLVLGLAAGYYRGRVDAAIVAGIDTFLALPGLIILLMVSLIFGGSLATVSTAVGILFIPVFTRITRANTLSFAQRDFVTAAHALGARDLRILRRDIFPNVLMPVLAYALVAVATAIVAEGALSFLGLSVQTPVASWGGTIAEGREYLEETPHISIIPAAVMFLTVLSFNLVGDTLRARFADVKVALL